MNWTSYFPQDKTALPSLVSGHERPLEGPLPQGRGESLCCPTVNQAEQLRDQQVQQEYSDQLGRLTVLLAPRYAVAGALFQLFCCSFSGLFSILATFPNFGEQFSFSLSLQTRDSIASSSVLDVLITQVLLNPKKNDVPRPSLIPLRRERLFRRRSVS